MPCKQYFWERQTTVTHLTTYIPFSFVKIDLLHSSNDCPIILEIISFWKYTLWLSQHGTIGSMIQDINLIFHYISSLNIWHPAPEFHHLAQISVLGVPKLISKISALGVDLECVGCISVEKLWNICDWVWATSSLIWPLLEYLIISKECLSATTRRWGRWLYLKKEHTLLLLMTCERYLKCKE